MIKRRSSFAALAAVALVGACGPSIPLRLVMRQSSVDVPGERSAPSPAAPPPAVSPVVVAAVPLPLPTVAQVGRSVPAALPSLCPAADQFAVPALAGDPNIEAVPAPATYLYREKGEASTGAGPLPVKLPYPPIGLRKVTLGTADQGYDFAVAEREGATSKTTAFKLVRPTAAVGAQPGGLYLAAMQWDDPLFGNLTFAPVQPMQFLPLPVQQGQTFASGGADPQRQTAMTLRGQVTGKKRVDACGSLIDTWEVTMSEVIATPQGEFDVTGVLDIATQYGGLSVQDHVSVTAARANALAATPTSDVESIINQLPKSTGASL